MHMIVLSCPQVIDSSAARLERSLFLDSGGVAFTFRNCEDCVANNSWVRNCGSEIFGAACVYYKGTHRSFCLSFLMGLVL